MKRPRACCSGIARARLSHGIALPSGPTLAAVIGRDRSRRSLAFILTGLFAGLALTLAMVGLYGVLAYVVSQRIREIGIRIALGASRARVSCVVLRPALIVTGLGLLLGLAGALALQRVLASLVFQTQPSDPIILGAAAGAMVLSAMAAAFLPAARAARVSPRVTLAEE